MMVLFSRAVRLGVIAAFMSAALFPTAEANQSKDQPPQAKSASGLSALTCKNGGREVKLTASRVKKGARHYLEFRTRSYPGSPSGHMYVVFGELSGQGKVTSRYHIGLAPNGLAIGFIGGALMEVPAHLEPRYLECNGSAIDAWRVSISPAHYAAVARKARSSLLNPPLWSMFGFNCNHFAASFGDIIGLKHPKSRNLMASLYLPAYIRANQR